MHKLSCKALCMKDHKDEWDLRKQAQVNGTAPKPQSQSTGGTLKSKILGGGLL